MSVILNICPDFRDGNASYQYTAKYELFFPLSYPPNYNLTLPLENESYILSARHSHLIYLILIQVNLYPEKHHISVLLKVHMILHVRRTLKLLHAVAPRRIGLVFFSIEIRER